MMVIKFVIVAVIIVQQVRGQGASSVLQQAVGDGGCPIGGNFARSSTPMSPCNWDNDSVADGNTGVFNAPDSGILAADDFVTTQPEVIFAMQVTYFASTDFVTGPTVTTSIFDDNGSMAPMGDGLLRKIPPRIGVPLPLEMYLI